MKKIILSALLATSLFSSVEISSNGGSISFDGTSEAGTLKYFFIYKNGRYIKRLPSKSGSIPFVAGDIRAIMVLNDNGRTRYVSNHKIFTEDALPNIKPNLKMEVKVDGYNITLDLTGSNDPDGQIKVYDSFVYKDNRYVKRINSPLNSFTLEPGNYRIISSITDDDGAKVLGYRDFIIEEIPEGTDGPNYTLGTPSNVDQSTIYTSEFYSVSGMSFLDRIHADAAYIQGWTGENVKIGVIDSGIDLDHPDLDGNIVFNESYISIADSGDDVYGHGTKVAGIIAAEKDGSGIQGVAYNADLYAMRVTNDYGYTTQTTLAKAVSATADLGLDVANISLGGTYAGDWTSYVSSYEKAISADVSLVIAAGNDGTMCTTDSSGNLTGCHFPAALPLLDPSLLEGDGAWIVVGSTYEDGTITSYSNTAGLMADFFMTAPEGGLTYTTKIDGYTYSALGTSFAAPMVTGAFALLVQKYPYLTGVEIRDILFASADDLGAPGVDEIYGQGGLNIETAMLPIGELNIPVNSTLDSAQKVSTTTSTVSVAGALSLDTSSFTSVLTLDDFNRGYNVDISANVTENTYRYDVNKFQDIKFGNVIVGLNEAEQSVMLGYDFGSFKYKLAIENDVFGSTGEGAFELNGKTYYNTIETSYKNFNIGLTYGYSDANVGGLFKDISAVHGLSAEVNYKWDNLTVGVKSPMTVLSGNIKSEIPVARASSGDIVSLTEDLSLKGKTSPEFYFNYVIRF